VDDSQHVSYKNISNSSIHQFKRFVRVQVQKSQVQLEDLLLLHSDEKREDMGTDDRNINGELPNMKHWILKRVIDNNWLRDEFMEVDAIGNVAWDQRAVREYGGKVNALLKSLLLLVHLTSG
jgi:hypothetical protein